MTRPLRIVGLAVAGIVVLWLVLELIALVFGLVTWIVSTIVSLAVLALLVYVGYLLVSSVGT
ncbi:hypothetical protein C491_18074 [Natronococcus amylolyticus DSM 10524]|uniref:Uncharacterized protein n=1 Tax=Natronococcus amylolyticus DSM 10524 TaxID=1227497 RepID=L9WYI7_9EURY|nr:hypothetical protein [Natronococcus amylolyticus]ELY54535.1 hypothetical protein C491_18074 [Natronococcus amylolyticus DSM 10524]